LIKDIKEMVTGNDVDETMTTPKLPRRRRSRAASLPANKSFGRILMDEDGFGTCEAQVVRSVCDWSAGQEVEDSCYKSYMDLISKAEHFVYIQNLYFISSTGGDVPKNRRALAILRRVRRAIQIGENFKVVVLTSVYPAGEIDLPSTRMLIGWTMKTICRGGKSILELLQAEFPDKDIGEYISFYSLRSWQHHKGIVYTEEVYVHSKVMIVDDRTVVVGSANINDRSMRGSRDSEINVVVRDKDEIDIEMNGVPFRAGTFAHDFRKRLWSLHAGVSPDMVADPIHPNTFHQMWRSVAIKNSEIFAQVFGDGIPENMKKLMPIRRSFPCDESTLKLLEKTQGYLIIFPYHFLEEEYLEPSVFNKEWFLKTNIFI